MATFIKKAIIYVRQSIEDRKSSMSLEHQIQLCIDKAKSLGFEIAEIIVDDKSTNNRSMGDTTELQRLLNNIKDPNIHAVVCWQKNRLVRNMADEIIIAQLFYKSNIEVHFANSSEPPMVKGDQIERLISIIESWRGETEAEKLRNKIKASMRLKAEAGHYMGGTFTGYEWNNHTRKMEPVPGEIDSVKLIFDMYLNKGFSTKQIAKYLNDEGYKTKREKKFYAYSVANILQCKIYCGYYRWGFTQSKRRSMYEPSEGYETKVDWVQPIITLDEWKAVQDLMISRS